MRCVITGHTRGIGKAIAEYFQILGWEVIGMSRVTGYDINTDYDKMVELARSADVFVNNTCIGNSQLRLLHDVVGYANKIICLGSIAGDYDHKLHSEYSQVKHRLKTLCKNYSLTHYQQTKILHLSVSLSQDSRETDCGIPYLDIVNAVDFWISNPRVNNIEFGLLLNPLTEKNLQKDFGVTAQDLLL